MIYMVDIDNTICVTERKGESWDYENSCPMYARIAVINKLYDEGHTIKYWTARGSGSGMDWYEFTKKQLESWGCKYHEFNVGKPSYDLWIDDKAIFCGEYFKGARP